MVFMKKYNIFIGLVSLIVFVSCNKAEWDKETSLSLKAESDINQPIEIEDYIITVEDIELTITGIRIHGERLQADDVERIYTDDVFINFSESQGVNYKIDLPVGTYEKLDISIDFDTEINSAHFSGEIEGIGNQSFQSEIDIPLNFTQIENLPITNENNENVVLIDENAKFFELVFEGQKSFNGINVATWNALMNANQGQNEIDLNSVLGNQFLDDINNNFLSTIQLKIAN